MIKNTEYSVREANLEDVDYIAELKIQINVNITKPHKIDSLLNDLFVNEYKKRWQQKLNQGMYTLVLLRKNQMIGFISYTPYINEDLRGIAEINHVYIIPHMRGNRLSQILFDHALDKIRKEKIKQIIIWQVESRKKIKAFYKKLGFKKTLLKREDNIFENTCLEEIQYKLEI